MSLKSWKTHELSKSYVKTDLTLYTIIGKIPTSKLYVGLISLCNKTRREKLLKDSENRIRQNDSSQLPVTTLLVSFSTMQETFTFFLQRREKHCQKKMKYGDWQSTWYHGGTTVLNDHSHLDTCLNRTNITLSLSLVFFGRHSVS